MSIDIVSDALKYYDINNEKYGKLKKKIAYCKQVENKTNSDHVNNGIGSFKYTFFDKNMNELFTSRWEILGKYYPKLNIWIWGWSLPNQPKILTTIIRKVFLYGTDIDPDNLANIFLKNELLTSRFIIESEIQIDIHCAIASYLSKKPFIYVWKYIPTQEEDSVYKMNEEIKDEDIDFIYYTFFIDTPNI